MELPPLHREVRASELPLERLAASKEVSRQEKIAEVSRQFEAVLLRQILGDAQKPLFKSSLMGSGGTTNALYQDMITQQLADQISEGGTFGFAKVLEKQLSAEYGGKLPGLAKEKSEINPSETAPIEPLAQEKIRKYFSPAIQPGKRI